MKIDRLLGITIYLLNHKKVNAQILAEHFEVSVRTILRDIDSLCMAGIPVISTYGVDGGYEIHNTFQMERQIAGEIDYTYIVTALKGLTTAYESKELTSTLEKIQTVSKGTKQYVRMTIILNETKEKIGTIEMFNRGVAPYYGVIGVLRLDLMSKYENEEVLKGVLQLVNEHFYNEFGVEWIVTKAVEVAIKRREVLAKLKYIPLDKFVAKDYYGRIEYEN